MAIATFAAGCFWGIEQNFRNLPGVREVVSGYTGGHLDHPSYEQVCSDTTGHAEAVQVDYDEGKVDYETLLDAFWAMHDPTQKNRQGLDIGSQYRSAIFVHDAEQRRLAEASRAKLENSGRLRRPVVTEIVEATTFWPAEDYHQRYLEKRGRGSCRVF